MEVFVSRILTAGALAATTIMIFAGPGQDPQRSASPYGLDEPLPRSPGAIRFATYNVENLFDHEDDPALEGEFDDADLGTPDARCQALAESIRAVDADIIAIQEVESLGALRWFRDTYLSDMGYDHVASIDVGYYRGIENAVMSRFEIVSAKAWPNAPIDGVERPGVGWAPVPESDPSDMTIQRSPIMANIRVRPDYELTVFSLHHKSGGGYDWKREAEALRIVEWVNRVREADPSRNIIVAGDFNAAPWDKSFRVFLAAGLIDTLDHRTLRDEEGLLYKTHRTDRVLDYILLNSAAHRELVIGSAHVYGTYNPPPSWNWRTDPPPPGYASDHYPVIIDLIPEDRL